MKRISVDKQCLFLYQLDHSLWYKHHPFLKRLAIKRIDNSFKKGFFLMREAEVQVVTSKSSAPQACKMSDQTPTKNPKAILEVLCTLSVKFRRFALLTCSSNQVWAP